MAEPESESDYEEPQHLYEARVDKIISKDGIPKWRLARFLLPIENSINEAVGIPHTPLLSDIFPHNLHQWPLKVVSKGWNWNVISDLGKKWKEWVYKLAPKYETLWIKLGIKDAIISSTYGCRYNQEILLGLIEFWCVETNTFVFNWGEVGITLEDVMTLGGYPVVGEVVNCSQSADCGQFTSSDVYWLEKCRIILLRMGKKKRSEHAAWLEYFMEEETAGKYEHVGFLSLWLSRFVFPSLSRDAFDNHIFPIASKLASGVKVALGPAVLANLYHRLRQIRDAFDSTSEETVVISGQFQLLQVWAFERFPALVQGLKNSLTGVGLGEPRVARWQKVNIKLNIPLVRSVLRLAENFVWRPYSADIENSFYKENEELIFDCLSLHEELLSYVRCIRASELVGTEGCKEKYLPNRVAMQFGMDQDLPAAAVDLNFESTREIISIFVPSRSFQSGVSMRYSKWWKDSMITREVALKDKLSQIRNSMESRTPVVEENEKQEEYDSSAEYAMPKHHNNRPSKIMRMDSYESSDSLTKMTEKTKMADFFSMNVNELVEKETFAVRDMENLQKESSFESLECFNGEWAIAEGVGPKNPIVLDEDPDTIDTVLHPSSISYQKVVVASPDTCINESSDSLTKKTEKTKMSDSASSRNVGESLEERALAAKDMENLQEEISFKSPDGFNGEWVTAEGVGPTNPIVLDEDDPDACTNDSVLHPSSTSSHNRTDLEVRIQKLEKLLGVN